MDSGLERIVRAAAQSSCITMPVIGDCMERAGIEDGGMIAVDFTHYPRPPHRENGKYISGDPCLCYASPPSADGEKAPPVIMCKAYAGYMAGQMVGTRYDNWKGGNYRMDCCFPAIAILGVVYAAWGQDGKLKWSHNPAEFPQDLQTVCTIQWGDGGGVIQAVKT